MEPEKERKSPFLHEKESSQQLSGGASLYALFVVLISMLTDGNEKHEPVQKFSEELPSVIDK